MSVYCDVYQQNWLLQHISWQEKWLLMGNST